MRSSTAERCREEAAREVLARIQRDRRRAPRAVQELLVFIEERLFDPDLTLSLMRRACGVRDTGFGAWFREAVGMSPARYVRERRLEVAARMLATSESQVSLICHLVGIPSPQTFIKAFRRWAGMSPREFRRRMTSGVLEGVAPAVWGWGVTGRVQARQAEALAAELWKRYWEDRELSTPPLFAGVKVGLEEVEAVKAEVTWQTLRELPVDERREAAQQSLGFTTTALYHRLHRASREVGREDRTAGVEVAKLAVECLAPLAPQLKKDELLRLRAHGWGWVGNACCIALDFAAAEEAFQVAEGFLAAELSWEGIPVYADLLDLKSGLRLYQRRHGEALELTSRALDLLRNQKRTDTRLLARILLRRGIVHSHLHRYEEALSDLREVTTEIEKLPDPEIELIARQHLCVLLVKLGLLTEAAEVLPRARTLVATFTNPTFAFHVDWSEALLRRGEGRMEAAETLLRQVHAGFQELKDYFHAAGAALDLATLCLAQHRANEAMTLVQETLPVFEQLAAHREVLVALELLRRGVKREELTQALLSELRSFLEREGDPFLLQWGGQDQD